MDNYHPESSFDKKNIEAIKPEILPENREKEPDFSSEAITVSVVSDETSPLEQDWFNLARKLRGQNRELLDTIVKLEQELADSKQQLQEQAQRSRHLSEQTTQFQTTQAQNHNLIDQLQASQQEVDTLQQQLRTIQSTFAQLERECTLLKEDSRNKTHQLAIAQRQISELHTRLKRQQRYTLQYKAALDECLSSCAKKKQSTTLTQTSTELVPQIIPIQPWSSQPASESHAQIEASTQPIASSQSPQDASVDPVDQTLEELFSMTTDLSETADNTVADDISPDAPQETPQPTPRDKSDAMIIPATATPTAGANRAIPFSFSIDRHKKQEIAKAKVDLPSFLRRN